MLFAFIYIFFFSLNILLDSKFLSFGMMPVDALFAAVSFFILILFVQYFEFDEDAYKNYYILYSISGLSVLCISRLLICFRGPEKWSLFKQIAHYFFGSGEFRILVIIFSSLGILWNLIYRINHHVIFKWIQFILIFILIRYGILHLLYTIGGKISVLAYRYSGIFDLPILFSMLVCIDLIVKERFRYEN